MTIPRIITLTLSQLSVYDTEANDLSPSEYADMDRVIVELVDGRYDVIDGLHRVAGLRGWAKGDSRDLASVSIEVVDATGYDEDVLATAADGFAANNDEAVQEILGAARP